MSQYLKELHAIPEQDTAAGEFNMDDDLAMFTNTQFFDFDSGQNTDYNAPPLKADHPEAVPPQSRSEDVLGDLVSYPDFTGIPGQLDCLFVLFALPACFALLCSALLCVLHEGECLSVVSADPQRVRCAPLIHGLQPNTMSITYRLHRGDSLAYLPPFLPGCVCFWKNGRELRLRPCVLAGHPG